MGIVDVPRNTRGFLNARQLNRHFARHGPQFGVATTIDYEEAADSFFGPKAAHVLECTRGRGDTVRFDPLTDGYGVIDANGVIRTYFKPLPCNTVPLAQVVMVRAAGECHDESSNLNYFRVRCAKW